MRELRRRQADASGRTRGASPDDESADETEGNDEPRAGAVDEERPDADRPHLIEDDEPPRLRPVQPRAEPGGGGGRRGPGERDPRRRAGGPRDGSRSIRSRVTVGIAIAAIIFVVLMLLVGIQLWTDAIWFRSVGFDQVFWTRIGARPASSPPGS